MKKNIRLKKYSFYLYIIMVLFLVSIIFVSCGKKVESNEIASKSSLSSDMTFQSVTQENVKNYSDTNENQQINLQNNISNTNPQDYLVYTANLRGKVENLDNFESKILELVKKSGGYISLIEKYNDDEIFITLKVPKINFQSDLNNLKKLFISIENERIQIEDISQQYIDLEARLKSKKESEKRYLALLQKASSVKDILEIEQALRQIREEIESYEANLRYYNNSIQYSTINVNAYIQKIKISGENFWTRFVKSISTGFNYLVSTILFIISLWPLIIIVIAVIFIIKKIKVKKK